MTVGLALLTPARQFNVAAIEVDYEMDIDPVSTCDGQTSTGDAEWVQLR